jgi:hypothetical protein
MILSRIFRRKGGYNLKAFAALIALTASMLVPAFASADQLTVRSIALSSASAAETNVAYTVNFTAVNAAGAVIIDFCSNSPVVGDTCIAPTGFDASGAASTTTGFTGVTGSTSKVKVVGTITSGASVSIALTGITNPTSTGPLYARIVTYDNDTDASAYTSTAIGSGAQDQGGVAMQINNTIGVSGVVQESMTFCVSGAAITINCGTTSAPNLKLGETVGSTTALISSAVSTGTIYTQISTNASTGAVVSLKSDAAGCGGLLIAGDSSKCYIEPAQATGITAGQAKFGVKTGTAAATSGDSAASGTFEPVGNYNATTYALNYVAGDATGVTSIYGDPFLDTASLPVNNENIPLTFGASISNTTPAGTYSADLNLIATGKF